MQQNSFITNQDKLLAEVIDGILSKSTSVDILVGYFYYSGFDKIKESLKEKKIRILVGLDIDVTVTNRIREVEAFYKSAPSINTLKEEYYSSFVKLFNETDSFDSASSLEGFKLFYSKILDGTLEIRKTNDPCHAKMYLFEYNDIVNEGGEQPGTVITGSSNLSYSGLAGRLEINARFSDKQSYLDGKEIFDELWKNAILIADHTNVDDFKTKVIEHIWYEKLYAPYLMYIRVLHEYFTIPNNEKLMTPHDITNGKFYNLKYQTDAVQMAMNSLENHNGVIVADVVGLGKSIIGSTVARNLSLKTIIIAPPHLKSQWEEYSAEFAFPATVFSSGQIEAALKHYRNISSKEEKCLIVIDEAHKYRNEYTEDYGLLHNLCSGNKVVLLTATPFNNRPQDIYSLLKLFQIPTKSTLKTVENLGASFKELIKNYAQLTIDQRAGKISDDDVKRDAEAIAKTIRSIISPLVVRRSRLDLDAIPEYKSDLENQQIEPIIPNDPTLLEYDLGDMSDLYLRTLEKISPKEEIDNKLYFVAARYKPVAYIVPEKKQALLDKLEKDYEIDLNLLIGRQTNVAEFMRKLLVRRFESSVAAFKQSLQYMINSSTHLLEWIDTRKKVPVFKKGNLPSVKDFYLSTSDDQMVEFEEKFEKYKQKGFFEIGIEYLTDKFTEDVKYDLDLLRAIQTEWFGEDNKITRDPKIDSFKRILARMAKEDPKRKIVVFTEFADTADYLGEKLKDEKLRIFKYTSKDASMNNKDSIRANFDAGYKADYQKDDYHVLIATDAISEGYNLHRAGAIFNYDIPYNPTRVIQRIGRINRINKKMFNELYIYNYFPTEIGENETRTKEISTLKMAMIHAIMGEDTKALTKEEELRSYFAERYNAELKSSEEQSWDSKYRTLLSELKGTKEYEEALKIVHRAKISRKTESDSQGVLLFGRKGKDFVFKMGNSTNDEPLMLSAEQAIKLFEASKDEEPFETSANFDAIYQNVKSQLFRSTIQDKNENDRKDAKGKVQIIMQTYPDVNKDYFTDLQRAIVTDALSGYELRYINKLKPIDHKKLPESIDQAYLNRIITAFNHIDEGEETLILAEEFVKK